MTKKIFAVAFMLLGLMASRAEAYELTYDKGYSTFTVVGVKCDTGTVVNITQSLPGFTIDAYRITNLDSADAVYIKQSADLSVNESAANVGERLSAGGSGVWNIGWNPDSGSAVKLFCQAADAAGAAGARLSVAVFGRK